VASLEGATPVSLGVSRLPDWRFLLPSEENRSRRVDRLKFAAVVDAVSLTVGAALIRHYGGSWFTLLGIALSNALFTFTYVLFPIPRAHEQHRAGRLLKRSREPYVGEQVPRRWRNWLRFPTPGTEKQFDHKEDRVKLVALVTALIFALNATWYEMTPERELSWTSALPVLIVVPLVWHSFITSPRPARLKLAIAERVVWSIVATAFVLLFWNLQ
jgi:hypothetical protein